MGKLSKPEPSSSKAAKGKDGSQGAVDPDKSGLGQTLHQPEDGKANVDIVFVHGINGDRIGTWTYTDRDFPENEKMWPRDFLPEKMPKARIVSFGYNADFASFYPSETIAPELTIDDYSTSLLESVRALRNGDEERPIIFVAHSMGGLVVANAISRDLKSEKALQSIPDNTIGAIFLGTPFAGSELASYGSVAVNLLKYIMRVQPDSLETLEKKSKKLAEINTTFAKFLKERDRAHDMPLLNIACFFEGIPVVRNTFVVPKESATWLGVDPLSIDANHMAICRFDSPHREGFTKISGKLVQWVEEHEAKKTAGGVAGLNAQAINVSGNVDYRGASAVGSILAGHLVATKENANVLTVNNASPQSPLPRTTGPSNNGQK